MINAINAHIDNFDVCLSGCGTLLIIIEKNSKGEKVLAFLSFFKKQML